MNRINIKTVRKDKGYTQEQLAVISGVGRVTIARIETGACKPSLETLYRLSSALSCQIGDLVVFDPSHDIPVDSRETG